MANSTGPLLVAGGSADPNLSRLVSVAESLGVAVQEARYRADESPAFSWQLTPPADAASSMPLLEGQPLSPSGAFIRYDVFTTGNSDSATISQRAGGWYQTLYGWLLSQSNVQLFNRYAAPAMGNKPAILMLAQQLGLPIPSTLISNEVQQVRAFQSQMDKKQQGAIAKPVAGGDYCYSLEKLLETVPLKAGKAATPAIVQNQLIAPEIRIYIIGQQAFAFEMRSPSLDYRINQDANVIFLPKVPPEADALKTLMLRLNMTFGAADFKTDPLTGQLVFLELNSSPMFVRFDQVADGALCQAMIKFLCQPALSTPSLAYSNLCH